MLRWTMVTRERPGWVGTTARRVVAVAWASTLLTVGCGDDNGDQAKDANSGAGGGGGSGGTVGTGACVDVSHVDHDLMSQDLEVTGSGFEAYEGLMIRVIATLGEPNYGIGETPIQDGAFDIFLPGALGDYTELGFHIDQVRNDACDPDDEILWQMATGPLSALGPHISESSGHAVCAVTPDTLRIFPEAGACNVNGNFDLTTPLHCAD
jgi:hypothetical protein